MSKLETESLSVERTGSGQILIQYHQKYSDGVEFGGPFVFEELSRLWLIEKLELALGDFMNDVKEVRGPDHFTVYLGGGQGYEEVNVNVHNHRDEDAFRGGLNVITAMPLETTRTLIDRLRELGT